MENDATLIQLDLVLGSDFNSLTQKIRKMTSALKKSLTPHGAIVLANSAGFYPSIIAVMIKNWILEKGSIIVTNVPGPKIPIQYGLTKVRGIYAVMPAIGQVSFGISAITVGDNLSVAVCADVAIVDDVKELRDYI